MNSSQYDVIVVGAGAAGLTAAIGLARSGVYRKPKPAKESDAALMRRIDELYTESPFFGSRRIAFELKANRKRVQRLMRLMGLEAVYPKPRLSAGGRQHKVYPYLLRDVPIYETNPATALSEIYDVPFNDPKASGSGFAPRGMDVDSSGVVWATLSSGQLASFDRRKCKGPLKGPNATGKQCPEGWAFHAYPGPNYKGAVDSASADSAYYNFVDRFDMLGVGKNIPMATGNESEGLLALVDGKFLTFRVAYPMGYYGKGMDGRIDDPNGGWKGRGLWSTFGTRTPFHAEGGKGTTSKVVSFQLRPDPLAR